MTIERYLAIWYLVLLAVSVFVWVRVVIDKYWVDWVFMLPVCMAMAFLGEAIILGLTLIVLLAFGVPMSMTER